MIIINPKELLDHINSMGPNLAPINKYTIIDNFDKLDVSHVMKHSTPPAQINKGGVYQQQGTLINVDVDIFSNTETINPLFKGSFAGAGGGTISIYNYQTPYSFNVSSRRYIPDMLRFITNRTFYLRKATYSIQYPPKWLRENYEAFPKDMEKKSSLGKEYWFDLLDVENTFNKNSLWFGNTLQLKDYYTHDGPKLPYLVSDFSAESATEWLSYMRTQKSNKTFYTGYDTDGIPGADALSIRPLFFNIREKSLGVDAPAHVKYSMIEYYSNAFLDFENNNKLVDFFGLSNQDASTAALAFRDVLQKLLLYQNVSKSLKHIYFVADLPHAANTKSKELAAGVIDNSDYVEVESTYNYFDELSEVFPENITSEWQLPNIYTYYSLSKKENDYYKKLATLKPDTPLNTDTFSVSDYYKLIRSSNPPTAIPANFGAEFPSETSISTPWRYKTVIATDKNYLNAAASVADAFPMYNKITIPSTKSDFLSTVFAASQWGPDTNFLIDKFITLLGNYFSNFGSSTNEIHKFAMHKIPQAAGAYEDVKPSLGLTNLQILDLTKMYFSFQKNVDNAPPNKYEKYFYDDKSVKFGPFVPAIPPEGFNEEVDQIYSDLFFTTLMDAFTYFNSKELTLNEIYEGKKCHTEVLAYEIAKFRWSTVDGKRTKSHIQSVFIPSPFSDEVGDTSYIDTQIFYGEEYAYEIFTHSLVVGKEYSFDRDDSEYSAKQIPTNADEGWSINSLLLPSVNSMPSAVRAIIVRAPYDNTESLNGIAAVFGNNISNYKTVSMRDKPPLPPDIVFHPYKDDDSKILVLLNINHGKRQMRPVKVFEEDQQQIDSLLQSQQYEDKKFNHLIYKTDDSVGNYLIYRTTKKPTRWRDFLNSSVVDINSQEKSGYNDFISPNTDYYYFARLRDVHGNLSNPTSVFRIRIVQEGGFPPYLITNIHNFSDGIKPVYEKTFKKYLKIRLPEATRKLINAEEGGGVAAAGVSYGKINNKDLLKRYKVRVTSKKTGRKIDINLKFAQKVNTTYLDKSIASDTPWIYDSILEILQSQILPDKDVAAGKTLKYIFEAAMQTGADKAGLSEKVEILGPPPDKL